MSFIEDKYDDMDISEKKVLAVGTTFQFIVYLAKNVLLSFLYIFVVLTFLNILMRFFSSTVVLIILAVISPIAFVGFILGWKADRSSHKND